MAEMYGKIEGCSLGRGGSMHLFDVSKLYGGNAIVSSHLPLAVGMALASKSKRKTISPAVFLAKELHCRNHEAMNRSTLGSSVLFVCENNPLWERRLDTPFSDPN
jgi:pyruvate dehydrogenase E1 component alpha subunit/2-oxoisovalerate dehydrogenase E1 component